MRWGFVFIFLLLPFALFAHEATLIEFARYDDTKTIESPQVDQAIYGELTGFPHTYEFTTDGPLDLTTSLLLPDIAAAENKHNAIMVKLRERRGVDEVTRLQHQDATWESFRNGYTGDRYRQGPVWTGSLEPGSYILEVNTAANEGKYVLVLGEFTRPTGMGYFGMVGHMYQVKKWFGKSGLAVLQSPLVSVPLLFMLLVIGCWYLRRRCHA